MNKKYRRDVNELMLIIEVCFELVVFTLIFWTFIGKHIIDLSPDMHVNLDLGIIIIYVLLEVVLIMAMEGFAWNRLKLTDIIASQLIAVLLGNVAIFAYIYAIERQVHVRNFLLMCVVDAFVILALVYAYNRLYRYVNPVKKIIMVYGTPNALKFKYEANKRLSKYNIAKSISASNKIDVLIETIEAYECVLLNDIPAKKRNDILKFCYCNGIDVYFAPKISDILTRASCDINLIDTPLLYLDCNVSRLSIRQRIMKRLLDLILCAIFFVPFNILIILCSIAIVIDDGFPIFFSQKRITKDNCEFNLIKLRSMTVSNDINDYVSKTVDRDRRITRVGAFIRRFHIDELPQIYNVIKGDMSFVGPRPENKRNYEEYIKAVPEFSFRNKFKSGITGYAQIYGRYNSSPYDKLRLDLIYMENYSLLMDLKILLRTMRIFFKKDTLEPFQSKNEKN
ncbi:sugar transferase [Anaerovoracaceae bacterium SGI.195]|nr:sugar transferase [Anaerovoracaceae bacterium]